MYNILLTTGALGAETCIVRQEIRSLAEARVLIERDKAEGSDWGSPDFAHRWLITEGKIHPENPFGNIPYGKVIEAY